MKLLQRAFRKLPALNECLRHNLHSVFAFYFAEGLSIVVFLAAFFRCNAKFSEKNIPRVSK